MNKILLQCNNICKYYKEGDVQTNVLCNINLNIYESDMITIIGSSGSGKSTLLNLLGGLDTPTSGEIIFSGQVITKMSANIKANFRNQNLGFIHQFHHLLPDFTVLENVAMPMLISNNKMKEISTRVNNILQAVGLNHRSEYRPSELSGGERQRVAIARALINRPKLVLADEPTGNLDNKNSNSIFQLINELNAIHGTAFLIATHDLDLAKSVKRQLKIIDGHISVINSSKDI